MVFEHKLSWRWQGTRRNKGHGKDKQCRGKNIDMHRRFITSLINKIPHQNMYSHYAKYSHCLSTLFCLYALIMSLLKCWILLWNPANLTRCLTSTNKHPTQQMQQWPSILLLDLSWPHSTASLRNNASIPVIMQTGGRNSARGVKVALWDCLIAPTVVSLLFSAITGSSCDRNVPSWQIMARIFSHLLPSRKGSRSAPCQSLLSHSSTALTYFTSTVVHFFPFYSFYDSWPTGKNTNVIL